MESKEVPDQISALIDSFDKCSVLLTAIGDENRQKILITVIRTPGQRVEQIREATDLSRPAVSHHLKILKDANVVTVLRKGTKNYYFPNCNCAVWKELHSMIGTIIHISEKMSEDETLLNRRRMLIDELDD